VRCRRWRTCTSQSLRSSEPDCPRIHAEGRPGVASHFTTNTLEPLGHTLLRDRLLSAIGWQVVSIPFFEWDPLRRAEQQNAYVTRRLLAFVSSVMRFTSRLKEYFQNYRKASR
jgi:hypothetical protein